MQVPKQGLLILGKNIPIQCSCFNPVLANNKAHESYIGGHSICDPF